MKGKNPMIQSSPLLLLESFLIVMYTAFSFFVLLPLSDPYELIYWEENLRKLLMKDWVPPAATKVMLLAAPASRGKKL